MSIEWTDTTSTAAAALSAVAAGGAWWAARRSASAAKALTRIEEARWKADRTPQFDLKLIETGNGQALLQLHLTGPDSLEHLDSITIKVGNDDRNLADITPAPGVTRADLDNFVWGPYKFTHGANGTDEHGRGPAPFPLAVGTGSRFAMQRTYPGPWMEGKTQGMWQGEYVGKPIRLALTCRHGAMEWVLARQLENPLFESGA
ncbi:MULTISPECIES: hypothetical protein [Streptomyces]|uniref:Uncharacterized protein n=2 Tax=Streptomyces TaxID=1883 RepID=A0A1E7LJC6_9ACTN|nr:hypothetical protein [Streptomyces nanshensis]OEV16276.1 hypothetical protein AN221_32195 [Streptomyces nanshensis]